jgi:hypothetical protein
MGAGLGFKTFVTGDVLTAADTNGYLMQGVWVFANAAARNAAVTSPQEGNFCFLKDTNATQFYDGAAWTSVGGGGKVLQVIMGSTSTSASNSTTTYADTNLTATITPTLNTSKVLIFVNQNGCVRSNGNANNALLLQLQRGGSSIAQIVTEGNQTDTALRQGGNTFAIAYLDSPATTSATTYKTQFKNKQASAYVNVQDSSELSTIILMEIGA